jgi:cell division transport system permease protein
VSAYFIHHLRVFIASLGHLTRNPMPTFMTSAVIAISLALPAGLYVVLGNVGQLGDSWDNSTQISLYLKPAASLDQASKLAGRLKLHKYIKQVSVISKEQGFALFRENSGFGDALEFLDENPLPIVLSVQPIVDSQQPDRLAKLVAELQQQKLVELAQLDMQWVKRLYAILAIAQRGIWVIGSLLALAVLLIIGNTIRLDIQNRRAEIEVAKLIGASNAFIRRPFLYTGLWYGLLGGIFAWLLTSISLLLLDGPVQRLTSLYNSGFELSGLSLANTGVLLALSCALGLVGSWLAVGRHLDAIEPS